MLLFRERAALTEGHDLTECIFLAIRFYLVTFGVLVLFLVFRVSLQSFHCDDDRILHAVRNNRSFPGRAILFLGCVRYCHTSSITLILFRQSTFAFERKEPCDILLRFSMLTVLP